MPPLTPGQRSLFRPWYTAYRNIRYGVKLPYLRFLDRYRLNDLDSIYTEEYFEKRAEPPYEPGAEVVVDVLYNRFDPDSVLDVGCAIGVYLKHFADRGVSGHGIEGAQKAVDNALVDSITQLDLRDGFQTKEKFDLVLCIEVAEHLHPIYADGLVDSVVSAAADDAHIVYTAAQPGQFGTHHVNLQPESYWVDKFTERGWNYRVKESAVVAAEIRERSETPLIMTNNLYIFN